jgi:hypothetical protein
MRKTPERRGGLSRGRRAGMEAGPVAEVFERRRDGDRAQGRRRDDRGRGLRPDVDAAAEDGAGGATGGFDDEVLVRRLQNVDAGQRAAQEDQECQQGASHEIIRLTKRGRPL